MTQCNAPEEERGMYSILLPQHHLVHACASGAGAPSKPLLVCFRSRQMAKDVCHHILRPEAFPVQVHMAGADTIQWDIGHEDIACHTPLVARILPQDDLNMRLQCCLHAWDAVVFTHYTWRASGLVIEGTHVPVPACLGHDV